MSLPSSFIVYIHVRARIYTQRVYVCALCNYVEVASACLFWEVLSYGHKTSRAARFVRYSGCPYLGGRNVQQIRYDRSGAGSLSVLYGGCTFLGVSVIVARFHCIVKKRWAILTSTRHR